MNLYFLLLSAMCWMTLLGAEEKEIVETTHTLSLADGSSLEYKATAGQLVLKDENEKPKASLFFVSYQKIPKEGPKEGVMRPVSFCFNGGPGSSSIWLHMGLLGPKRVSIPDLQPAAPPYTVVPNGESLLAVSDLVLIDPVSTGFSIAIPPEEGKKFHGVDEDAESIGEFIRLYLTKYQRWSAPKFLIGESYGSTRAAVLADHLQEKLGIVLNGLVLISPALHFQSLDFSSGNDLPYLLFLPTYTATAWYHKQLSPELQQNLDNTLIQAKQFVEKEYLSALFLGDALPSSQKMATIDQLHQLTSLPKEYLSSCRLRPKDLQFLKQLLKKQQLMISRMDSRWVGPDSNATGSAVHYDPGLDGITGSFVAAFQSYLQEDLQVHREQPYRFLTNVQPWNYGVTNQHLNVSDQLESVLLKNPYLRIFVASGIFDVATPFYATAYALRHLQSSTFSSDQIVSKEYPAGHMMYLHPPSFHRLSKDLLQFYTPPRS